MLRPQFHYRSSALPSPSAGNATLPESPLGIESQHRSEIRGLPSSHDMILRREQGEQIQLMLQLSSKERVTQFDFSGWATNIFPATSKILVRMVLLPKSSGGKKRARANPTSWRKCPILQQGTRMSRDLSQRWCAARYSPMAPSRRFGAVSTY